MEHGIAIFFWNLKDSILFEIFQIFSGKIYIIFTCTLFTAYAFFKIKKKAIVFVIAAVVSVSVSDLLCYRILKPAIKRQRPVAELMLKNSQNTISLSESTVKPPDYSMPSNHASNIFAFFTVYLVFVKKFWSLLFVNSVIISISRIILIKHYPSDVIAGIFLGIIIGFATSKLVLLFLRKNAID